MARFYITTSIMYTNAAPHVGFALELVQADAVARYRRMLGDEVKFLTGTDEHGTKVMRTALAAGEDPQPFTDRIAAQVGDLARRLNISNTDFIRTTDRKLHWPAVQKLWSKLAENGDLEKRKYEGYYCVGHEAFIKSSELEDGLCPLHKSTPERISEENWFFRLTKYKTKVREALQSGRVTVVPERRRAEILNLLDDAEDVSFSRPSAGLPWGIPVPGDESQTMYVWADALTNYLSALGYGTNGADMPFWPADVHLVGKDIIRFHAIFWPAMLIAAGLELPRNLYVHGFITVDGQKMSKSLGNVINPADILDQWSAEVVRYFFLRDLQSTDDSDFSWKNLENRYRSDLANGLGNLLQRTATLIATKLGGKAVYHAEMDSSSPELASVLDDTSYHTAFRQFRLHDAASSVWEKVGVANAFINASEPWKQERAECERTMAIAGTMVAHIAYLLQPLMPETSERIGRSLGVPLMPWSDGQEMAATIEEPLFPRK